MQETIYYHKIKSMKFIIVILVLELFLMICPAVNAQPNLSDTINYGKRNVVPGWVKKKTTPEQYQIWKTLSGYYHYIDYNTLKRSDLDSSFWDITYKRLEELCKYIQSGKIKVEKNEGFSVVGGNVIRSAYCSEIVKCKKQKVIIHSNHDGYDAHVELIFYYFIDKTTGEPCILKRSVRGISFSGLQVKVEQTPPPFEAFDTFKLGYIPEKKMFYGYYAGELYFTDAIGNEHREDVSENFYVTLDN